VARGPWHHQKRAPRLCAGGTGSERRTNSSATGMCIGSSSEAACGMARPRGELPILRHRSLDKLQVEEGEDTMQDNEDDKERNRRQEARTRRGEQPLVTTHGSPGGASTCIGTGSSVASTSSPRSSPRKPKTPLQLSCSPRSVSDVHDGDSPWSCVSTPSCSCLQSELNKITESGLTIFPSELFSVVVHASRDPDSLAAILMHLKQRCTDEQGIIPWHRVLAGLHIIEQVMRRGAARELLSEELACSLDFDLENYIWKLQGVEVQWSWDWRSQSVVRKVRDKAAAIWDWVRLQEQQSWLPLGNDHCCASFHELREWAGTHAYDPWSSDDDDEDESLLGDSDSSDGEGWVDLCEVQLCEFQYSCRQEDDTADMDRFFTPMSTVAEVAHPNAGLFRRPVSHNV